LTLFSLRETPNELSPVQERDLELRVDVLLLRYVLQIDWMLLGKVLDAAQCPKM
jgi:hypothetical protein